MKKDHLDEGDLDFIADALNYYWLMAERRLSYEELSDYERKNLEHQKSESSRLIVKINQ